MPYFVETSDSYTFPAECPYCEQRRATTTISYTKKMYSGFWIVAYTFRNWEFQFPICRSCDQSLNRMVLFAVASIVSGFAVGILGGKLNLLPEEFKIVMVGLFVFGIANIIIWRWRLSKLGVAHVSSPLVVFQTSSHNYAMSLARSNNSKVVWKPCYFKLK